MSLTRNARTALVGLVLGLCLLPAVPAVAQTQTRTLTLMTHDSFYLPDDAVAAFEQANDVHLEVLYSGDAGAMVNQAILTADHPLADVLYGVDNTFLSRALTADIFEPYQAAGLESVPGALQLDPEHRVTPIDYGDVCLNLDGAAFGQGGLPVPSTLWDLADPALKSDLVVENPATSSPGLAFLMATIVELGDDPATGWQAFWRALRENDVAVTSGWEEAYYSSFSGGSGAGDRPIVVSYASSPAAEVVYGDDPAAEVAPTFAIDPGCFRQVEFAGVLRGTAQAGLAQAFIDDLLSPEVQAQLPLAMYVYPAREDVALPDVFTRFAQVPTDPVTLDPAAIAAGRDAWINEWTDIVLH